MAVIDSIPLWGVFVLSIVVSYASLKVGAYFGARRVKSSEGGGSAPLGSATGAVFGLLAFMLAFCFSLAATRFDERRQLVLKEANAVGTAYLRVQLLPEKYHVDLQELLRFYVHTRVEGVLNNAVHEAIARSESIHDDLWRAAAAMGRAEAGSEMAALFIQSLNEVIDIHSERVSSGLWVRLPPVIWAVLTTITILSMTILGYQGGLSGNHDLFAQFSLFIAFSMMITLIADLDRSQQGFMRTSQRPMVELRQRMQQHSAEAPRVP